jgi:Mononegavirales RNA dependent RNA polymerase/Mononegavirales mRNA-capping region V
VMYVIELQRIFRRNNAFIDCTPYQMTAVCLWNRALGGFPGCLYSTLCMRGVVDRLSSQLSLLKYLMAFRPSIGQELYKLCDPTFKNEFTYGPLIADPYSLNILTPVMPESRIKKELHAKVVEVSNNPILTEVLDSESAVAEELVAILSTMYPCNPRLCHEIVRCSNEGLIKRFEGLFDKSRSVAQLISQDRDMRTFMEMLYALDMDYLKWAARKLSKEPSPYSSHLLPLTEGCSCLLAQELRETSWQLSITGVTMPCVSEQVEIKPWHEVDPSGVGQTIQVHLSDILARGGVGYRYVLGRDGQYLRYKHLRYVSQTQKYLDISI